MGAYGGRKDVMSSVAPLGPVYQAGTLSGNPVAMAAGMAQLKILRDTEGFYSRLNATADSFFNSMEQILSTAGLSFTLNHIGSLGCLFFTGEEVVDNTSAQKSDTQAFRDYFSYMLSKGIYLAPSQFEAMFISAAHSSEDLEETLDAVRSYVNR